ncbi:hypothetical protein [Cutibacterium porci]|uniref:hypothetical protein n=1 Tax=Cutibacterium porci TaxID=2605781 RepID=UPI001E47E4FA|nr:hypothetical protein [Cutibacterium porci]
MRRMLENERYKGCQMLQKTFAPRIRHWQRVPANYLNTGSKEPCPRSSTLSCLTRRKPRSPAVEKSARQRPRRKHRVLHWQDHLPSLRV